MRALIKKFIKNIDETESLIKPTSDEYPGATGQLILLMLERRTLSVYLPQKLTDTELQSTIHTIVCGLASPNVGIVMKTLKETLAGKGDYDGAIASAFVRAAIDEKLSGIM